VSESELQFVRLGGFALAATVALTLQRMAPHAGQGESWRTNLALWGAGALAMGAICGACACAVAAWAATAQVGVLNLTGAPWWLALPATVLALDLVSYAWHRANHSVAILWRFHRVHHSDTRFAVSTGLRFHPGELVLSLPLRLVAVAALGASVEAVVAFEVVFALANLVEHGDIDYPLTFERRLATVLVTPALHRYHHGLRPRRLAGNFGTVFSFWDRLFASYAPNDSRASFPVGLPDQEGEPGIRQALAMPFRRDDGGAT
jgi:sterol desaturase/sphingolipid hydroxylase (fatty acid hydroxylase superfamily)